MYLNSEKKCECSGCEGIRYEIAAFAKSVSSMKNYINAPVNVSIAISKALEDFYNGDYIEIK